MEIDRGYLHPLDEVKSRYVNQNSQFQTLPFLEERYLIVKKCDEILCVHA